MNDNQLVQQLAAREQAEQAEALNAYYALVEVLAEGADIGADDETAAIVAKAGKTSKDLEADLALFRRRVALAAEVAELDEAQANLGAIREEGAAMRARHEEEKKRIKAVADEWESRNLELTNRVRDLRASASELAELNAKIEQARTGAQPKPAPAERKVHAARHLRPTTKRGADGWTPPSPHDYDYVDGEFEGRRVQFYRHKHSQERIYPPSHPLYGKNAAG